MALGDGVRRNVALVSQAEQRLADLANLTGSGEEKP